MEAIVFLAPAFAACVVVAAIHVYLGNHVITRGVIFVDIALAQIAALGAMLTVAMGAETSTWQSYLGSLVLALAGAAVFALTGKRHLEERVPQEAAIGILYVVAASAVIVVASKLPHGSEEIERMLTGNILWVTWPTVIKASVIYAALGVFHWYLRRPLLEVSRDPKAAHARGRPVRLLDFAFYGSFAIAISLSVPIAGVLLVFTFLIVPSAAAFLLADRLETRLLVGWTVAIAASLAGLAASWLWDLPTGATIVICFGGLLLALAAGRRLLGGAPA